MPSRPPGWRYTPSELRSAVAHSRSSREVLSRLGLSNQGGGAYATLKRRIADLGIDTSHMTGQGWNVDGRFNPGRGRTQPLEVLLVRNSPVTSMGRLKKRLLAVGLLQRRCQVCGLGEQWCGKTLVLRMDHINGDRTDNRIENLRLVCPNCDSQLPTFAGRNIGKSSAPPRTTAASPPSCVAARAGTDR